MESASIAERVAYGRPLDITQETDYVPVALRPGTALTGRILLSLIFLVSGFAKLADPAGAVGKMVEAGIPSADALVYVAAAAEILGGLAIAFGFLTRIAAIGLIVFLIPTTLLFHHFWDLTGREQVAQAANFFKNLGLMGGLALLIAFGAGAYSVDRALRKPVQA